MKKSRSFGAKVRRVIALLFLVVLVVGAGAFLLAYLRSTNDCPSDATKPANGMTAAVYCEYGGPSVVKLATIEKPVPTDSQVLVRVRAASVNPLDWHYMRGEPSIARFGMGLRKPSVIQLGVDFAGTVESVGRAVTQFKRGAEVFGGRTGAFAQYVTLRESRVISKPPNLTFEEAAAVPVAAITALQAVRDKGGVRAGQNVLVNGASGGVGTFAVQIAKWLGAEVTGVQSTRNLALVRSLGADHVVDYTKEDFTKGTQRYDVIIDNVGNHKLSDLLRVLTPNGKYVMVGGPSGRWIAPFPRVIAMMVKARFVDQELLFFISDLNQKDMMTLHDLLQSGKVKPVIDRRYPLSEAAKAIEYLETGRARGKVIITID